LHVCAPDLPVGHAQVFVSPGVQAEPDPLFVVDEHPAAICMTTVPAAIAVTRLKNF
jgi:hypothetical protein